MQPIKIILNPIAGRGYGGRIEPELRRLLDQEGIAYDLVRTEGRGHAVDLAREASAGGFEVVVAAGGDGTMHEVTNGLMQALDQRAATQPDSDDTVAGTMAVLPIGTGSDFANTIQTPFDLPQAVNRLASGQVRVIDVGRVRVDDEPFLYYDNVVGIGFDGQVTLEALKFKHLRGLALYLPVVFKTIMVSYKPPRVRIEYGDQVLEQKSLMICVTNGPREGGGFFVTPDAVPDDGLFDLCVVKELSKLGMFGMVPHFMKGSHVGREPVTMGRAKHVVITSPDNLVAHVDGEMLCTEAHRIECEILPARMRVLS